MLPEVRTLLDDRPDLWQRLGDVGRHAEQAWINLIAGSDLTLRESIVRKAEQLKSELGIEQATTLERLLIERVVIGWLKLNYAEVSAAQAMGGASRICEFWQRRVATSHRHFMLAVGALAILRRLRPAMPSATSSPGTKIDHGDGRLDKFDAHELGRLTELRVVCADGSC